MVPDTDYVETIPPEWKNSLDDLNQVPESPQAEEAQEQQEPPREIFQTRYIQMGIRYYERVRFSSQCMLHVSLLNGLIHIQGTHR